MNKAKSTEGKKGWAAISREKADKEIAQETASPARQNLMDGLKKAAKASVKANRGKKAAKPKKEPKAPFTLTMGRVVDKVYTHTKTEFDNASNLKEAVSHALAKYDHSNGLRELQISIRA